MKVNKGDVLTFRFKVEDVEAASPFLSELLAGLATPAGATGAGVYRGVLCTASARSDVFEERDALLDGDGDDFDPDDDWEPGDDDGSDDAANGTGGAP